MRRDPVPAHHCSADGLRNGHRRYTWEGRQWGWPVDAAAQVQSVRPDLASVATDWAAVMGLAQQRRVMIALRPPHGLMSFCKLCANLGRPCRVEGGMPYAYRAAATRALQMLHDLAALVDPAFFGMDPITVLEEMAAGNRFVCAPLIFGYISYSLEGMRANRVDFIDNPETAPGCGPVGSALGGTGRGCGRGTTGTCRSSRRRRID